jgi:hypothetical protein
MLRMRLEEPPGLLIALIETTQAQRIFHSRPKQAVDPSLKRCFEMLAEIEDHERSDKGRKVSMGSSSLMITHQARAISVSISTFLKMKIQASAC